MYDTLGEDFNVLIDKWSNQPSMPYLRRNAKVFDVSPVEMVKRVQTAIHPATHVKSPPRSLANVNPRDSGRYRSGGGEFITKGLAKIFPKSPETSPGNFSALAVELAKLVTQMEGNNDYRQACIEAWKAKGGYWEE
jgi:hypothetical protein